jgi:superoxide reductase
MTELNQVYKCNVCGNIVEVLHAGAGALVCCGQPMQLMIEKMQDEGMEKHVPVVKKTATSVKVKIGAKKHPMEEKHYIEWVEIIADCMAYRQFLKPGDKPKAVFKIKAENVTARIYCNVHGLWKS